MVVFVEAKVMKDPKMHADVWFTDVRSKLCTFKEGGSVGAGASITSIYGLISIYGLVSRYGLISRHAHNMV